MTTERQIIEKQKELIRYLKAGLKLPYSNRFESEIAALEKELEQEPELTAEEILQFLSDKMFEDKIVHDYKDGKFDYRRINEWFLSQAEAIDQYARQEPDLREELLRYKIWENIFSGKSETVETLIERYFEYLKSRQ